MDTNKFVKTLINATRKGKIEWSPLPRKYFDLITNLSSGIVDAYYADYKDDTGVVIYQFKSFDSFSGTEEINHYISIVDENFRYKYEIPPVEFEEVRGEVFQFYREIQKSANKIDEFFEGFMNDFE
ncbi:hypothetical protein KQI67_23185 [Bacillus albus]|uniref:hypothetical protein n=1 Tax=Bacillus TaxID=1386 RepID=UPI000BFC1955|nr:hypothetical protein [Bacillus albus]MBU5219564.1 hypothetical protein [Bacillus albus]PGW18771.1 hypothetical protein COD90_07240 [Bacillus cereus]RFB12435.1 hypothetical protein DZB88_17080 [Bacillus sp. OE]